MTSPRSSTKSSDSTLSVAESARATTSPDVLAARALAEAGLPLVEELRPAPDAAEMFARLSSRQHCLFLDSARREPTLGRYSFLACEPFDYFSLPAQRAGAFDMLAERMSRCTSARVHDLPPFQGGAAGLFSYDLARQIERVPLPRQDEFAAPAIAIGLYDVVVAFDHAVGKAWIISQGLPELDIARRRARATARLHEMRAWLAAPASDLGRPTETAGHALAISDLSPQHAIGDLPGLTSNFSADEYLATIRRAIEFIRAGDIFQVNLAQRLLYPATRSAAALYLRLRECNPATFAAYFDTGELQIVSASPERFLRLERGQVEARPIKGTRQRVARPEADLYAGDELRGSEKDRAENVMIVDLMRNDLSRVCEPDSVHVAELCRLETYEFVQHLVSIVRGKLRAQVTPVELLRAAFPGGSITGAPKVRAMEIIAELEPTAHGAYCGALGYIGFDGTMDTNILIRTVTAGHGWWQAPVGGGIVAQSVPAQEYAETWHKAAGLLRAFAS